ncbi:MAG: TIGR03936 family radical SAM-associated protein [Chloroflexota bacterium]
MPKQFDKDIAPELPLTKPMDQTANQVSSQVPDQVANQLLSQTNTQSAELSQKKPSVSQVKQSPNKVSELPERQRVRIFYEKGESIKFISHLDEFRMWERTIRRADLPLLYKQGFNPQPHIQFASPLGVGFTGIREPMDIILAPPLPLDELRRRLVEKLPPGVRVHHMEELPVKTSALQSQLIGADYRIILYAEPGEIAGELIQARIEEFLAQSEIWRQRERKKRRYHYNLRPLVLELTYQGYDAEVEEHLIFLRVQQREGATGRPDEVVSELGFDDFARTLCRTQFYLMNNPDDVSLFAPYPIATKAQIEKQSATGDRRRRFSKKKSSEHVGGRSINERAGDEFG